LSIWKSETFRRFLLVAGTLTLAWGLVEFPALINIFDYEALEYGGVWGNLRFIRVADPELTHLEPPHAHYSGSGFGGDAETVYRIPASERTLYRWDLRYDRIGFRNDADLSSADTIVVGDSMVEGMTVSNSDVVTSVLQRLEGKTVANLAQYGYGPQQEMIVLKRYGLPLRPHTVVWVFSESSDLADFIGYRRMMLHPPNSWNFFLQRSFSRLAFRQVTRFFAPPKPLGIKRSGEIQEPGGKTTKVYFTNPAHPLTGEELGAVEGTAGILAEARRLSSAQGASFLVVFAPDKFRVYHDLCVYPQESECGRWVVSDLPERLRKAVASVSPEIGYLDLTAALTAAAKEGARPYYSDDVHWSAQGHRIAAEAIHAYHHP